MTQRGFIIDLDGTVFDWGSLIFLPEIPEQLKRMHECGRDILFVTMRGHPSIDSSGLPGEQETRDRLDSLGIDYRLIWAFASPRTLVDDDERSSLVIVQRNDGWEFDEDHA